MDSIFVQDKHDKITALIYCVSLTSFDEVNLEGVNQLQASVKEFQLFSNMSCFVGVKSLLIFTDIDLFKERLTTSPLTACFPEYQGTSFDQAKEFIESQFGDVDPSGTLIPFNTLDYKLHLNIDGEGEKCVKFIDEAVCDIIMWKTLDTIDFSNRGMVIELLKCLSCYCC